MQKIVTTNGLVKVENRQLGNIVPQGYLHPSGPKSGFGWVSSGKQRANFLCSGV